MASAENPNGAQIAEQLLEKTDLFPRRLLVISLVLTGTLVVGVTILVSTMQRSFEQVHREHIPVLEMASINVRLATKIKLQSQLVLENHDDALLEELSQDIDSLAYNLKDFRAALENNVSLRPLMSKLRTEDFMASNTRFVELLKKGARTEALALQRSSKYQLSAEQFTGVLGDLTEFLSQLRDDRMMYQLKLIRIVLGCFALLALELIVLFARIYRAYRSNLDKRFEAEHQVVLLSQGRKALIHVLCHDLGNPVSSIAGLIGFVEKLEGESRTKTIEMIKSAAANAQGIIELIRKLQALETGKLQLDMGDYPLATLVQESLGVLRQRIELKKLELFVEIDPAISVHVEKTSFVNSVANNVFTNAIKFSKEGSKIEVRAQVQGSRVVFSVRDHGVGMPAELAASVFNEIKATTRQGTSGEKGTGFGMPLVKKFVVAYGGEIEVVSSEAPEDHGTEIRMKLPKAA